MDKLYPGRILCFIFCVHGEICVFPWHKCWTEQFYCVVMCVASGSCCKVKVTLKVQKVRLNYEVCEQFGILELRDYIRNVHNLDIMYCQHISGQYMFMQGQGHPRWLNINILSRAYLLMQTTRCVLSSVKNLFGEHHLVQTGQLLHKSWV
jgi:hypothetical protein